MMTISQVHTDSLGVLAQQDGLFFQLGSKCRVASGCVPTRAQAHRLHTARPCLLTCPCSSQAATP